MVHSAFPVAVIPADCETRECLCSQVRTDSLCASCFQNCYGRPPEASWGLAGPPGAGLLGLSGNGAGRRSGLLWALPPGPERALRWPQEAYKTLPEREIVKGLDIDSCRVVVVVVVVVIVVVFALFFLVVVPCVPACPKQGAQTDNSR